MPVIGLVAVGEQSMADRYTYVPTIGLLTAFVWSVAELTPPWRSGTVIISVASAAGVVLCMWLTAPSIAIWRSL